MMKHILGQAIYQFTIIMILIFSADKWIPEYRDNELVQIDGELLSRFYSDCPGECKYMRSGRPYFISSGDDDYERFETVKKLKKKILKQILGLRTIKTLHSYFQYFCHVSNFQLHQC